MASAEDEEANRYRENCALFSIAPIEAFETALRTKSETCDLSGLGIDDNAMVGFVRDVEAERRGPNANNQGL